MNQQMTKEQSFVALSGRRHAKRNAGTMAALSSLRSRLFPLDSLIDYQIDPSVVCVCV